MEDRQQKKASGTCMMTLAVHVCSDNKKARGFCGSKSGHDGPCKCTFCGHKDHDAKGEAKK